MGSTSFPIFKGDMSGNQVWSLIYLSPSLTPEDICYKVANNQLTKIAATELLISLLEESDNDEIRAKCISAFSKLASKNQKIFRIIENCLVSDKSALVRRAATKVLVRDFPKKDMVIVDEGARSEISLAFLFKVEASRGLRIT